MKTPHKRQLVLIDYAEIEQRVLLAEAALAGSSEPSDVARIRNEWSNTLYGQAYDELDKDYQRRVRAVSFGQLYSDFDNK